MVKKILLDLMNIEAEIKEDNDGIILYIPKLPLDDKSINTDLSMIDNKNKRWLLTLK